MEQQYRGYFVTVASKEGIPHPIAVKIYDLLERKCDEIDYVIEPHKSGLPHMHIMLLYCKDIRKSDLKRKVQTLVFKFISRPLVIKGIDLKVIDNITSFKDYMEKTGRECLCPFTELKKYVINNFSKAKEIIDANKKYKETCIKYAYDNLDTWKEQFKGLKSIEDMWRRYVHLIKLNYGKTPTSQWKLQFMFESHLANMKIIEEKDELVPSRYLENNYNKDKKFILTSSDSE